MTTTDLTSTAARVAQTCAVEVSDLGVGPTYGARRVAQATGAVRDGSPVVGFGAAAEWGQAEAVAVMEWAERAALGVPPPAADVVTATWRELGARALDPRDTGLYLPDQYAREPGLAPFAETARLDWVAMEEAAGGAVRLVPLELAYPFAPLTRRPIAFEASSGTAAGSTFADAQERALAELVERDALMLAWHRRGALRVQPFGAPDVAADLRRLADAGWITAVLRIDQDVALPCVAVVAVRGDRAGHGLGCSPDGDDAVRQAVRELAAGLHVARHARRFLHLPVTQVRTPADHAALYDGGPLHGELRSFLARATPAETPPASAPAPSALEALTAAGFAPLVREITPRPLRELGLAVVRALVPGLVPLSFGWNRLRLGLPRLGSDPSPSLLPHFIS